MTHPTPYEFPSKERQLRSAYHFHRFTAGFCLLLAVLNSGVILALLSRSLPNPPAAIPIGLVVLTICILAAVMNYGKARHARALHHRYFPSLTLP